MKTTSGRKPAFLTGLALGAGLFLLGDRFTRRHPERTLGQFLVDRALDHALGQARAQAALPLRPQDRYVIFSDHHKGARDPADDFQPCEATYLRALDYYYDGGHNLVILGDAEELWEQDISSVLHAYRNVLASEARFHPGRYLKVSGNHDDAWELPELVEAHLGAFFPGLRVRHELVFTVQDGDETLGEILLVHGHQGSLGSDLLAFSGPRLLPFYRRLQNLTGLGRTSPSQDACLRARYDTRMYRWASRKHKLVLVAGHTHRPVWSSRTHLEKLLWELAQLQATTPESPSPEDKAELERLRGKVAAKQAEHPPCTDTIKTRPSYFNTGCCRYADGDITGIELVDGRIRLVKWDHDSGSQTPVVLEDIVLVELFAWL